MAPGGKVKVSRCQWNTGLPSPIAAMTGSCAARRRRAHRVPAELDRPAEDVAGAVAAGDDLGAEADAEDGLVGVAERARQRGERREIRVVVVVDGALLAAEDDDAVVAGVAGGQRSPCHMGRRSTSAPASASA